MYGSEIVTSAPLPQFHYTQKTAFFKRVKLVRVLQKQRGQTISRTILFGGASPLNSPKKMNFPAPKRHTSPSNK